MPDVTVSLAQPKRLGGYAAYHRMVQAIVIVES